MKLDLPADIAKAILDSMGDDATPEERGAILTGLGVSWAEALLLQALKMGRARIERVDGYGWCFVDLEGKPVWALERTRAEIAQDN
jgi:hypothetical protein